MTFQSSEDHAIDPLRAKRNEHEHQSRPKNGSDEQAPAVAEHEDRVQHDEASNAEPTRDSAPVDVHAPIIARAVDSWARKCRSSAFAGWTGRGATFGGVGLAERTGSCPGCGGSFPLLEGPSHRYMIGSRGCWHAFTCVLAADYVSPERMSFHQLVVDAYAAQHPSGNAQQQVQSVGLHLMTLCLFLEHGADPAQGTQLHRRMVRRPAFHRLERSDPGGLTVLHVPVEGPAAGARAAAYEWAEAVWTTYRHEHPTVRAWLRESGFEVER